MDITIDLSGFTEPYAQLAERAKKLPMALVLEASILVEHAMKIHAPYKFGTLKSSIYPEIRGNRILVTPHVYYAVYTQRRGKSKGWVERTAAGAHPMMQAVLDARMEEVLGGGL